jgi:chemotaxis protein CheD
MNGNLVVVDIADMKISNDPSARLITYSLGSCLGVSVFDAVHRVGGMAHFMLPLSSIDPEKAAGMPFMFVDTGLQLFLNKMIDAGAEKKNFIIKAAGGSQMLDEKKVFNIGDRNVTVMRKLLWKNNILIKASDVGGSLSRTMSLMMDSGSTILKINGKDAEL